MCIVLEIEPGFDCTDHSIEVFFQVHVPEFSSRRVMREDLLSDAAKAEPEGVFIIRIQPEYRSMFLFVPADVLNRQLGLSNPSKPE
jgi:hypothetical protein